MKTYQFSFSCQCEGMPRVEVSFKIKKDNLTRGEAIDIFKASYVANFDLWEFVNIVEID